MKNQNQYVIYSIIIWTGVIIYFHQMTLKNIQIVNKYNQKNYQHQQKQQQHDIEPVKKIKGPSRKWTSSLINIPTRGAVGEYSIVGYLTGQSGSDVLPLTGRQTYSGSTFWNYFTTTNTHLKVQISVLNNKKQDCQDNNGCAEFNTGDKVWINGLEYTVTMHRYNQLRYIPMID